MTAAMRAVAPRRTDGPRWLRWALIRDGRIEKEAVFGPDRPLTIGVDGDLPGGGKARPLIAHRDGEGWVVVAAPGLRGRTDEGDLEALSDGGQREVRLTDSARARLELGGLSLLVQMVDRPPAKLVPQLPVSLRGGLLSGADWWFTSFVAASFCLHIGVVMFLLEADWPVETSLVPQRHARVIFEEPGDEPIDPPEMDGEDGEPIADNRDGEDADDPSERDSERTDDRPRRADRRPSPSTADESSPSLDADAIARSTAEHMLIGVEEGLRTGAIANVLADGAETERAEDIFGVVEGTEVASGPPGPLVERDGREASANATRGIGALDRRGDGDGYRREGDAIEEQVVEVPRGAPPALGPPQVDDPIFDPRELFNRLRGRMSAVRRCYDNVLSHGNPDAAGRVTISMQVMPAGNLSNVHAATNNTGSDPLGACIVRSLSSVRVPSGPDLPVTVEFPIVLARQN